MFFFFKKKYSVRIDEIEEKDQDSRSSFEYLLKKSNWTPFSEKYKITERGTLDAKKALQQICGYL